MRRQKLVIMLAIVFLLRTVPAFAAPYFSRGVSIKGAIAYQDSLDPAQFWFFPTTSDELLGERLTTFRVAHYGFGPAYYVQTDDGSIKNATGAVIAGTFSFDLSAAKRQELIDTIKTAFSIPNPRLLPIPLRESHVSSVVLAKFFEQNLPSGFQIGPEVAFAAGSGSSLFAQILANAQVGGGIQANRILP